MGKGEEKEREKSEKVKAVDGRGVCVPVFRGFEAECIGKDPRLRRCELTYLFPLMYCTYKF